MPFRVHVYAMGFILAMLNWSQAAKMHWTEAQWVFLFVAAWSVVMIWYSRRP